MKNTPRPAGQREGHPSAQDFIVTAQTWPLGPLSLHWYCTLTSELRVPRNSGLNALWSFFLVGLHGDRHLQPSDTKPGLWGSIRGAHAGGWQDGNHTDRRERPCGQRGWLQGGVGVGVGRRCLGESWVAALSDVRRQAARQTWQVGKLPFYRLCKGQP